MFAACLARYVWHIGTRSVSSRTHASHLAVCTKYRTHPQGVILPQSTPFQFYLPLARTLPPLQTPPNAPGHANSRRYHRRLLQQEKDGSAWNLRHSHWRARGARGKNRQELWLFRCDRSYGCSTRPSCVIYGPVYVWVGGGMNSYAPAYPLCT